MSPDKIKERGGLSCVKLPIPRTLQFKRLISV
jgi:hypothetical protein